MKAVNIQWDTDGDQELLKELPTEIDIPDGMDDEDEISDYISDVTGFVIMVLNWRNKSWQRERLTLENC